MNSRERQLAILEGKPPDRIPWVPRLLLWYNAKMLTGTMPAEYEGMSLREVERALGVGSPARAGAVCRVEYDGVEVVTFEEADRRITEYRTPVGVARQAMHFSQTLDEQGLPGRVLEHLLKGPADYVVWEYVMEHSRWLPTYDEFTAYDAEIGGDGLPMVSAGDVPVHEFAQQLAGYEDAYLQMVDYPDEVDHLLAVMQEVHRERLWPVLADAPARLYMHGGHLSSQFTPPPIFRKYCLPYYEGFMPRMHEAGKAVAMHADNDTSLIVDLIEQAGWDMVECFVTAPMVPLTLRQARESWGDRVIIFGGLPSLLLAPSVSEGEFRAYMHEMLEIMAPGKAFILGVADNVMPDSMIERVAWVSELLEERGWYPLGQR